MSLIGKPAPDFTLVDHKRNSVTLSSLRGQKVVLAFYPAAFTGVCQKELCTFRDTLDELNGLGGQVFGVSVDGPFSNAAFAKENNITYPLLSDLGGAVAEAYGVVWKNLANIPGYNVANRSVFVVGANGDIVYAWVAPNPGVEPDYAAVKAALA